MASMQSIFPSRKMWVTAVVAAASAYASPYVSPTLQDLAANVDQISAYVNDGNVTAAFVLVVSWLVGYITPPASKDIAIEV